MLSFPIEAREAKARRRDSSSTASTTTTTAPFSRFLRRRLELGKLNHPFLGSCIYSKSATVMRLTRTILPVVRTITTVVAPLSNATLRVGDAVRERRRFTDADVVAYAAVSGDRNPVHLDDAVARDVGGFQRGRIVHGMLVASVFPSIIATHFPGAVYVSQTLRFAAPVYVRDEVVAQVQALHIRAMAAANGSMTSRNVVKFATKCFTDEYEGSVAIDGEAIAVLPTLNWTPGVQEQLASSTE